MERPHILVADDELVVPDFTCHVLEAAGYIVFTAANGDEAFRSPAPSRRPSICWWPTSSCRSSAELPCASGFLQEHPAIRVLLVSGAVNQPLEGVEFLQKPFQAETC
jgi:DNA-binding NtrC family response regulator